LVSQVVGVLSPATWLIQFCPQRPSLRHNLCRVEPLLFGV